MAFIRKHRLAILSVLLVLAGVSQFGIFASAEQRTQEEFHAYTMEKANKGDAVAEAVLAREYVHGTGVERDWAEAVKWYRKIADQGYSDGAFRMGELYRYGGPNLPQDWQEAYFWFCVAANNPMHDPDAPGQRDDAAKHLTTEQIAAVQKRAQEWKPAAPQVTNATHAAAASTPSAPPTPVTPPPIRRIVSASEMPPEARAMHDRNCPDISQVKKVAIQVPPRNDGQPIPNNDPVVLNVPIAYLLSQGHQSDNTEFLEIDADYETLQPYCIRGWPDARNAERLGLWLSPGHNVQGILDRQKDAAKKPEHWQLLADAELPDYEHYFNYRAAYFKTHLLIPKTDKLGTPYLITCIKPKDGKNPQIVGDCELWVEYKHELFVKAHFPHTHLQDLQDVYRKTNQLLDRFVSEKEP